MGLLDDAIREHLELKRRRGADPGEIALQEHDALDPVYGADDAAAEGPESVDEPTDTHAVAAPDPGDAVDVAPELALREDAAGEAPAARPDEDVGVAEALDPGSPQGDPLTGRGTFTAQETAELDMEAVLAAEDERDGPQGDPLGTEALSHERLDADWEFPGNAAEDGPPEPIPGQERMPFE